MVNRERHVVNGNVPRQTPFHVLWVSSKILVFRRIILKSVDEQSTKALQDAVIHACVGVEVIPEGPPEGDHMANGRVEMAVREVKRQCRTLRIFAVQDTSVRIADESPLLSWLPRFAAQVMNEMRIGKDRKTSELRRTGRRWRKPMAQFVEKVLFRKIGGDGVSSFGSRMTQESSLVIMIEQEQFCLLPRMELCEANVGQDRHKVMLGNQRTWKVCVVLRDRWWLQN